MCCQQSPLPHKIPKSVRIKTSGKTRYVVILFQSQHLGRKEEQQISKSEAGLVYTKILSQNKQTNNKNNQEQNKINKTITKPQSPQVSLNESGLPP